MTGTQLRNTRKKLNLAQSTISKATGISQSSLARWEADGDKEIPKVKDIRILEAYFSSDPDVTEELVIREPGARYIGQIPDKDNGDTTKFTEISPGRFRMKVDIVPFQARAGYLAGFGDTTYVEELPKHEVTVTKYHGGKYLAFEVVGDSMYDGTINSIPDKSTITARVLDQQLWRPKLHTHNHDYWVFIHKTEGILVKMIKSQNLETGEIVLESLNPNKDEYPDQLINLGDVYQILNVVKIEREL